MDGGNVSICVFQSARMCPFSIPSLLTSQVDLVEQMGPLPFNLEFFTECQDMQQLLAYLDAPPNVGGDDRSGGAVDAGQQGPDRESSNESGRSVTLVAEPARQADAPLSSRRGRKRFKKLTEEICDVVDSYGLVCFLPLNIQVSNRLSQTYPRSRIVVSEASWAVVHHRIKRLLKSAALEFPLVFNIIGLQGSAGRLRTQLTTRVPA